MSLQVFFGRHRSVLRLECGRYSAGAAPLDSQEKVQFHDLQKQTDSRWPVWRNLGSDMAPLVRQIVINLVKKIQKLATCAWESTIV